MNGTGGAPAQARGLAPFVFALFFIFGGITSLNDVLIPKLKELFTLSYFQAMLVQSAFFAAYFLISLPGAALVKRIGYMRGAVAGLLTMMAGCLLFIPASKSATFGVFLFALFVLASGITIVQVVANPLISLLGPPRTAHSRLTFAQAFNSLGTTVFPYFGSLVILGSLAAVSASQLTGAALDAYRQQETQAIVQALPRPRRRARRRRRRGVGVPQSARERAAYSRGDQGQIAPRRIEQAPDGKINAKDRARRRTLEAAAMPITSAMASMMKAAKKAAAVLQADGCCEAENSQRDADGIAGMPRRSPAGR